MSIHIDPRPLCLFKQHFQVPQIMTRDQNPRIFADTQIHFCNLRIPVGLGVSRIQQSHSLNTVTAGLKR